MPYLDADSPLSPSGLTMVPGYSGFRDSTTLSKRSTSTPPQFSNFQLPQSVSTLPPKATAGVSAPTLSSLLPEARSLSMYEVPMAATNGEVMQSAGLIQPVPQRSVFGFSAPVFSGINLRDSSSSTPPPPTVLAVALAGAGLTVSLSPKRSPSASPAPTPSFAEDDQTVWISSPNLVENASANLHSEGQFGTLAFAAANPDDRPFAAAGSSSNFQSVSSDVDVSGATNALSSLAPPSVSNGFPLILL